MPITTVTVIGGGTIGQSWAALFAAHGLSVRVCDPREKVAAEFARATASYGHDLGVDAQTLAANVTFTTDLQEAADGADLIQENGPEQVALKADLFARAAAVAAPHAVLASSSSTFPPSQIAAPLPDEVAARLLVAHPFNPPHLLPLVELVAGERTDPGVVDRAEAFYTGLGKLPVRINKEIVGHIANRLQFALLREVIQLVAQDYVDVVDMDRLFTASLGTRYATIGPIESLHLGGGAAGIAHMLQHLGPAIEASWASMTTPRLDEPTTRVLTEQADAAFGVGAQAYQRNVEYRDAATLAVLDAVARVRQQYSDRAE